jgi:hypothetical protein
MLGKAIENRAVHQLIFLYAELQKRRNAGISIIMAGNMPRRTFPAGD